MKRLVLSLSLAVISLTSFSQTYTRQKEETADQFIKRITGVADLAHPVIETSEWSSTKKVLIYFVPTKEETVVGYALVPSGNSTYKQVLIDTFAQEGGSPKIESVFFANADKDKQREVVVLTSWPQQHHEVNGTIHGTFIYDAPHFNPSENKLTFLKTVSKKVDGGFEGTNEGTVMHSKFKTVTSVRQGLKKMGF